MNSEFLIISSQHLIFLVLVSREWRGRGLGVKLMSAAEDYAVGLDFHTIHLSTHDKQDFYRHLGYEDGPPTSALRDCVARLDKEQVSNVEFVSQLLNFSEAG